MSNEVREDAWLRRNPPHPGPSILNDVDGMTLGEAAKRIGVSRASLSRLVNGRCAISPAMALKLERAGWGTADIWVRLQAAYDLAQARRRTGDLSYGGFEEARKREFKPPLDKTEQTQTDAALAARFGSTP